MSIFEGFLCKYIVVSYIFIHYENIYLLFDTFRPFNVIISMIRFEFSLGIHFSFL